MSENPPSPALDPPATTGETGLTLKELCEVWKPIFTESYHRLADAIDKDAAERKA
jgi:hypothetical protein